jgi:hypothetical protein
MKFSSMLINAILLPYKLLCLQFITVGVTDQDEKHVSH